MPRLTAATAEFLMAEISEIKAGYALSAARMNAPHPAGVGLVLEMEHGVRTIINNDVGRSEKSIPFGIATLGCIRTDLAPSHACKPCADWP